MEEHEAIDFDLMESSSMSQFPTSTSTSTAITAPTTTKVVTEFHLPPPPVQITARGGGAAVCRKPKGRIKRIKRAKKKKPLINISGLDLLHTQTLLSTKTEGS